MNETQMAEIRERAQAARKAATELVGERSFSEAACKRMERRLEYEQAAYDLVAHAASGQSQSRLN